MQNNKSQEPFGDRVREARIKAGLSIRQLGTLSEVDFTYIAEIERGKKTNPSPEVVDKLIAALGLEPRESLPPPRMYFRRKFGVSEEEADVLARLIEHQMTKDKETKPNEATDNKGGE